MGACIDIETLTDEELVIRCKQDLPHDTRSYEVLVHRHMSQVYSVIYRIISSKEEAEDITQEVFVKVFHGLKNFEQQASFDSWLYRIATNSALDGLDKFKRHQKHIIYHSQEMRYDEDGEEGDTLNRYSMRGSEPEELALRNELRAYISYVLGQLDRQQRRLLVMRDFDDLSYDEIAGILKVKLSAAKMRIHRARLSFQELFSQTCGNEYFGSE